MDAGSQPPGSDPPPASVAISRGLDGMEVRLRGAASRLPILVILAAAAPLALWLAQLGAPPLVIVAAVATLGFALLAWRQRPGPVQAVLTPHCARFGDRENGVELALEEIEAAVVEAWPSSEGSSELAILWIRTKEQDYQPLRGLDADTLRWLAREVEGAAARRRAALAAAGHDPAALAQPPPEASRLRSMARQAAKTAIHRPR